jgi:mannosyltransferase
LVPEPVAVDRRRRSLDGLEEWLSRPRIIFAGLVLLTILSGFLRYRAVAAALWLDEAQAVNIAKHSIGSIPHLLKLDGSPPLYYVILHAWISVFGDAEARLHMLSIAFAALTVPAAFWAGRLAGGVRAGWLAALLMTVNTFVSGYADQARMYTLLTLLTLLTVGAFLAAFVHHRRRYIPVFSVALAATLYTHNWAFFVAGACVVALIAVWWFDRRQRRVLIDGLLGFGLVAILYAPWLPQLLYQAQHTGAPWSTHPTTHQYFLALGDSVGGTAVAMLMLLVGTAGLIPVVRGANDRTRVSVIALLAAGVAAFFVTYAFCKLTLAFAPRYFAIFAGPLSVAAAVGFSRMGRLGVAATLLAVALMFGEPAGSDLDKKTNVAQLSRYMSARMHAGDVVFSTQPEQTPTLLRYMRPGLTYAIPYEVLKDPSVMDWRDALTRLRSASVQRNLEPLIAALPVGGHLLIVNPVTDPNTRKKSNWYKIVRSHKLAFMGALYSDPRLKRVAKYRHLLDANIAVATSVLFEKTRK